MLRIGFDVGGTNIKAGIMDDQMNIVVKRIIPFPKNEGLEKVVQEMDACARDMLREKAADLSDVQFLGIAVAGGIDPTGHFVVDAHNLGFQRAPLRTEMEIRFPGIPVRLVNDANAAALAELYVGALQGCKTAVLMTLGTGVGGGIILGGKMFNGGMEHGVELGHMTLLYDGPPCTCGNRGCIESVCTATWLLQQGQNAATKNKKSRLFRRVDGEIDKINAKTVIDCAKEGDPDATQIFQQYIGYLSAAITSIAALLDPEVIALGGGVSLAGDFLLDPLRKKVEKDSFFKVPYTIVPAKLGNEAGMIGAAMMENA